jgi:Xaa-Pro aminopeptidase
MNETHPRLQRLAQVIASDGLDALLVMSPAGACYLSGCYLLTQFVVPERQAFVLLTAAGEASYLVCNVEERMARHESWIEELHTYVEYVQTPVDAVAALLAQRGLTRAKMGIEGQAIPYQSLRTLQDRLPGNRFDAWDEPFGRFMMIKDEMEIAALERAGKQTQAAIESGVVGAPPGSSELDVANRILAGIMDYGMMPMFNVFASGAKTMMAHAEPAGRVMQPGELFRLDMGGRAPSHYLSDMARTAVVGAPSAQQEAIYQKLFAIQTQLVEACRPGMLASALYRMCERAFQAFDLPFGMPHIGHGMGIGLHEAPMIHPGNDTPLQPGMVLNIEPMVALPARQEAYHIEDLLLVTDAAPRLLTTPQPELLRMPA